MTKSKPLEVEAAVLGCGMARVEDSTARVLRYRRAAAGVQLGQVQPVHAVVAQQQRGQHADGAAAQHQHPAFGQRSHQGLHRQIDRMQGGGGRLGEGGGHRAQAVGQCDQAAAGDAHALGKGAWPLHAHHRALFAQVVAALQAELAAAAGDQRVAGDALACLPAGRRAVQHRGRELMPQHQAGLAARVVAVEGMHVGPADAGGVDAHQHLAIGQCWLGALVQLHLVGLGVDQGFHGGLAQLAV